MANEGRIEGRVNGSNYELWQNGTLRQTIPLTDVDDRLRKSISRNRWEPIP